ncbi:MAG: family transcriptional regulator [Nocardioides sp.]|nr:family transcriptional regulator [Nocardioides sp.]
MIRGVRFHSTGRKRFHHTFEGELELDYEAFELPANPGPPIDVYTAPPDSASAEALALLASWSVTLLSVDDTEPLG